MKIHIASSLVAFILAIILKFSLLEWFILLLTITLVLITETINTALEISVDLTTKKRKLRAMLSKDIAAGAVLIASLNALIIGYLLFIDKILKLVMGGR
jgi:diacylglycerol kinase (ATP)